MLLRTTFGVLIESGFNTLTITRSAQGGSNRLRSLAAGASPWPTTWPGATRRGSVTAPPWCPRFA